MANFILFVRPVFREKKSLLAGLNRRPFAYKANALPLRSRPGYVERSWSSGYDRRLPSDGPGSIPGERIFVC